MPKCLICGNQISDKDLLEGNFYCVTNSKRTPVNFICNNCYGIKVLEGTPAEERLKKYTELSKGEGS